MELADYLRKHRLSCRALGKLIGLSGAQVQRIASGERGFSTEIALKIEDVTKGAVTPSDLAKPHRRKQQKAAA